MGHDYGTDEDLYGTSDPLINAFDLGADPMKFAMERMVLAEELMKTLGDKVVEKGEGYQRVRQAFNHATDLGRIDVRRRRFATQVALDLLWPKPTARWHSNTVRVKVIGRCGHCSPNG